MQKNNNVIRFPNSPLYRFYKKRQLSIPYEEFLENLVMEVIVDPNIREQVLTITTSQDKTDG